MTPLTIDDKYIFSKPKSFREIIEKIWKKIGGRKNCKIESIWSEKMPYQHELKVYNILPNSIE
jgi:hypothetical protein